MKLFEIDKRILIDDYTIFAQLYDNIDLTVKFCVMKPSFQHLGFDSVDGSFLCYWVKSPRFGFHWHYHPEYEISFVVKGRGTRLVGDHVDEFTEGDMVFLGSDLPHTWISSEGYFQTKQQVEFVVLQFPKEIIEHRVLEIPELKSIGRLLRNSNRGILFEEAVRKKVGEKLINLIELTGFQRYHLLLEILDELGSSNFSKLASEFYTPSHDKQSENRIDVVCSYIHQHFLESISLQSLANLANMSEAAFCRFFKKMTGKTAMHYINDLKIGKACELLGDESLTISEISFRCGYNNITHFNRSFLKRKGVSPSKFRQNFMS